MGGSFVGTGDGGLSVGAINFLYGGGGNGGGIVGGSNFLYTGGGGSGCS